MADKRITELTNEKLILGDGDYTIVDSNEGTYKYKLKRIMDAIPAIDDSLSHEGQSADAKATGDEIADVKRDLSNTKNIINVGGNLLQYGVSSRTNNKFWYNNNGTLTLANGAGYDAFLIPITSPTKIICFKKTPYAFVTDSNGDILLGANNTVVDSFDLSSVSNPACLHYSHQKERTGEVFVSYDYENHLSLNSIKTDKPVLYSRYVKNITPSNATMIMNDGNYNAVRQNIVITGSADLTGDFVYAELGLMRKNTTTRVAYIAVNATTLIYHLPAGNQVTQAHGLTIANNLTLCIKVNAKNQITAEVISNGSRFAKTWIYDNLYDCTPYFELDGMTTQGTITWECKDINKNIWLFGDSYMTYDSTRWTYNLEGDGFANNCMIDQYGGRGSASGLQSFSNLVKIYQPRYAVWGLGMNDGSDSGAPSSTWLSNVQSFIKVCESYGVTPILCTIPTVPTVNNEYKNALVRESGYQYIDFAKAVGAQSDGTWYSGMLSNDNVHPSATGGMALYYRVLSDFPQITISDLLK